MTTRKTPRMFRGGADETRSSGDVPVEVMPPIELSEAVRGAVAAYINSARVRAELIALARQHGEAFAVTDEDVLDLAAFDQLLNLELDVEPRLRLFRRLLAAAIAHRRLDEVDPQILNDEQHLQQLWNETFGWGDVVQALLEDPAVNTIKILGTTVIGESADERVVRSGVYASAREPLSRAEFLAQACGVAWNRSSPPVTLPLARGMRVSITREPRVIEATPDDPGLLIVMRRGRSHPWTMHDLVERRMLDRPAAEVLAALVHAGCSCVISGPRDVGKTAVLEALVNTRDPETHILLVEAHPEVIRLNAGALVTRLQRDENSANDAVGERREPSRENQQILPDLVVLSEVYGDEAGDLLQQAEMGQAVMTTVHADDARAALRRFARLADVNGHHNSFAGMPEQALRVISEAFHVVVDVAYSRRLGRRYVREVLLLDGFFEPDRTPLMLTLITTMIEDDTITWSCRATVRERALQWNTNAILSPARVTHRLADLPDHLWQQIERNLLAAPAPQLVHSSEREQDRALRRARAALRDGAWDDVVSFLTAAARITYNQSVFALIDQALQVPALAEPIDQELAEATQRLRAALEAWDIDQAREISGQVPSSVLAARRRAGHQGWQEAIAIFSRVQDEIARCQAALSQASAHRQQGDLSRALSAIEPIDVHHLPPDLARTLLTARRSLLTQLVAQSQDDPRVQQRYVSALEQVNQVLAGEPPASGGRTHATASGLNRPGRLARSTQAAEQAKEADGIVEHLASAPPVPVVPARPRAAHVDATPDHTPPAPAGRTGWLDAALAHTRERARLRQAEEADREEAL